ncbi:nuclear transport factor 2 family protein [Glycomyces terrestris]|uniref:Nuclear transport factor 2 family protein n=1 Tax=Glycomyces terrestris TaxID=2493553 RepID=A0A426V321_9ACTN|nr:nuclear transport factor 2 family protein [Glycomyces terrestris]RRS01304.1 nuclear transport factor 2 family protein [Glycomyces terrestris]
MATDIEALLALEHQGWASLCDGTGGRFYGAAMTEAGLMVLAHGQALDRAAVVASLRDAPAWDGYEIADPRLVPLGADAAALVYTGRAWRAGDGSRFEALMASTYVLVQGEWRLALYQQTPVPAAS